MEKQDKQDIPIVYEMCMQLIKDYEVDATNTSGSNENKKSKKR